MKSVQKIKCYYCHQQSNEKPLKYCIYHFCSKCIDLIICLI